MLKRYAVIDGASEEALLSMLEELDPPVSCLYVEPVQTDLVPLAPYLVEVTEPVEKWLLQRETPWGIYLTSEADMKTLRQHLRKYLQVIVPNEEKPVFFRFYDPRNIWFLCSIFSDWQLHHFLGPVHTLGVRADGILTENDFRQQREQFPRDVMARGKMFTFSPTQMEQFNRHFESLYIDKLAGVMKKHAKYPHQERDFHAFAEELFYYLARIDITEDRVIRGLAQLFIKKGYFSVDDIPDGVLHRLESSQDPTLINAQLYLIEELGKVPLIEE